MAAALLLSGAGHAQADPRGPDPQPVEPGAVEPDRPYLPVEPCDDGCDWVRPPGPDEPGPIFLNPQPLPPGRR
ncbi:hypothetical protein KIH27_17840 [Mycobacterium sp. M1]|uniref:Uncharacterized protein n=1 Tax=Mycolicibacter acidiphilus TaxID=2835306 RepID=A0ABS5RMB6_9MYCO|nr:hypothetical protein [Mycolicibacter acidiphilus]MBS9535450.1 hypothetical protein [Mycolicibacter acidiphilus]